MSTSPEAIKTENKDYKVFVKLDATTGKIADAKPVSTESQFKAYSKEGSEYQLAVEQTVRLIKFGTLEGFLNAIPDPAAQLDVINRGTSNKAGQKLKEVFTELDESETNLTFEPTDILEVLPMLQEGPKKQKVSETEKLIRQLKAMNLPEAAIQAIVAQAAAAQASSETTDETEGEDEPDSEEVSA